MMQSAPARRLNLRDFHGSYTFMINFVRNTNRKHMTRCSRAVEGIVR